MRRLIATAALLSSLFLLQPAANAVMIDQSVTPLGGGTVQITYSVFNFTFDPGQGFIIRLVDPEFSVLSNETGPTDWLVSAFNPGGGLDGFFAAMWNGVGSTTGGQFPFTVDAVFTPSPTSPFVPLAQFEVFDTNNACTITVDCDMLSEQLGSPLLGQVIDSGMTAPEPGGFLLTGAGLVALFWLRRRRA